MKTRLWLTTLACFAWMGTALAVSPVNRSFFGKVAIHGYDPVAYFTDHKPVKGNANIHFTWHKAVWHFTSTAHLKLFKADPEKYTPQYGGYCAWAVAQNDTADIDPTAWTIVDGKLYLNYNADIQKKWLASQAKCIKEADANWPGLLK